MIRTEKRLRLCTVLLVCNLVFIWGNSLLPGEISGAISDWVKALLAGIFPAGPDEGGGGLLRKIAHFTEFTALGMLLSWRSGMLRKGAVPAFCWGAAAAAVDETIQRFVPDRGPSIWDVALDSCGVLTGIILLHLGHNHLVKHKHTVPMEDK